jgi:hypothetical protein
VTKSTSLQGVEDHQSAPAAATELRKRSPPAGPPSYLRSRAPYTFDPSHWTVVHWPASSIPAVNVRAAAPTSGLTPTAMSMPFGQPLPSHDKVRCGAVISMPSARGCRLTARYSAAVRATVKLLLARVRMEQIRRCFTTTWRRVKSTHKRLTTTQKSPSL